MKLVIVIPLVMLAACSTQQSPRPEMTSEAARSAGPSADSTEPSLDGARPDASPSGDPGPLGDPQSCRNDDIGFTVDYPEDWWANERVEPDNPALTPIPGCTYFAPEPVELAPNAGLPRGIAVWVDRETQFMITGEEISREETEMDGRRALLVETEATGSGGFEPSGTRTYRYIIDMGDGSEVLVSTSTLYIDDAAYEEAKPILDAMMETLDFDD